MHFLIVIYMNFHFFTKFLKNYYIINISYIHGARLQSLHHASIAFFYFEQLI